MSEGWPSLMLFFLGIVALVVPLTLYDDGLSTATVRTASAPAVVAHTAQTQA